MYLHILYHSILSTYVYIFYTGGTKRPPFYNKTTTTSKKFLPSFPLAGKYDPRNSSYTVLRLSLIHI